MESDKPFFQECKVWWWGGYYIPVRNSWNYKIEKRHLTKEEKEIYEQTFGEKVLYDHEFMDWYCRLKSNPNVGK
jgi:hypothetical protein